MKRKHFLMLSALVVLLAAAMPIAAAAPLDRSAPAHPVHALHRPAREPSTPETVDQAALRLNQDSGGEVTYSYRAATGAVSFAAVGQGGSLFPAGEGKKAEQQALDFFTAYGAAFGLSDARSQLASAAVVVDDHGMTHVSYTQVHQGVPVFGSFLKAHFDAAGRMSAANGAIVPGIKIPIAPDLSAEQAGAIALQELNRQLADADGRAQTSWDTDVLGAALLVHRSGLLQDIPGSDRLVYEVEAGNGASVREFFYVDAFDGQIVDQISGIHTQQEAPQALDRQVSELSLANLVWSNSPDPIPAAWASGSAQQVSDWNDEAGGAKEIYNLFGSMAGRDSYDAAGVVMRTVNNDPSIFCPNANWNGASANYCTGVTSDDTVAHEWGHAYTEYTSDLIYQWQPGALSESYSDIWGEVVDLLNGRGADTPGGLRASDGSACSTFGAGAPSTDVTYRWLLGEDVTALGGAIRDLWRPECYGDPGRVSSGWYSCTTSDFGGVHTNSGVPNHAFALLVDGGASNGQTITGLGLIKAAHIFWRAQSTYLGPASGFPDLSSALGQSCTDLLGQNLNALSTSNATPAASGEMITAADCNEVADASAAVELATATPCTNFLPLLDPNAPALCSGGAVNTIWSESFTDGIGAWTLASSFPFVAPIDWASSAPALPSPGSGGPAAFAVDRSAGVCSGGPGDTSGVMQMTSPVITIPPDITTARLSFYHWVAAETTFDGGHVKISIDGGPFSLIAPDAYTFNPLWRTLKPEIFGNTNNPLAGQFAFTGADGGSLSGSWGQSQINLLTAGVMPGDTIQLRYDFGMNGCTGYVGWYVDDVTAYACEGALAVTLASFDATAQADHVLVTWETVSELNNAGFTLYRSATVDGERTLLATVPSQAPGGTGGAMYTYTDAAVAAGETLWYWLEAVDLSGGTSLHGPVSVTMQAPTAVTVGELGADAGSEGVLFNLLAAAVLAALAAGYGLLWRTI